jgi:hypothetical protein
LPNVDVTAVEGRDDMKFLMVWEGGELLATNSSIPIDGWQKIPQKASFKGGHLGCPSIKQVDGWFLVVGGGEGVHAARSKDLIAWEQANESVMVCGASRAAQDRRFVDYPDIFTWSPQIEPWLTDNVTSMIMNNTRGWDRFASDLDLTEWSTDSGVSHTLFVFICGNQRTDGYGAIAEFPGSLKTYMDSLF